MLPRTLTFGLVLLCVAGGVLAAEPDPVEELLSDPSLRGAQVGLRVLDLASGATLLDHEGERALIPASNQKLLTSAAALEHWGPAHRFETPVWIDGALGEDGVLEGSLWIEGRGDPGLVSETLWKLAEEIRLSGVRRVTGGIGVDASFFDGQRFHPDWEPVSARAYHAPVGAFAANYSSFRIEVRAGHELGEPAVVSVAPLTSYLRLEPQVRTESRNGPLRIDIEQLPSGLGDRVRVRGVIGSDGEGSTYWRAVTRPETYAASLLRTQLEAQGISVGGSLRTGPRPAGARELLRFEGESLGILVVLLNKWSNNFVAEQLTKLLGADVYGPPASWDKGTRAVKAWLEATGLPQREVVVRDGSGLSARNRVSAHVLVEVLRRVRERFDWGPEYLAALPLGGIDGTLEDRLNGDGIHLRAKTGHLRSVASLSGYVETADARTLAFAVLVNGARGSTADVDTALDRFVARLSRTGAVPELAGGLSPR